MKKSNSIIILIIAGIVAVASYSLIDRKEWLLAKQQILLDSHTAENRILVAQLEDYKQHVFQFRDNEYRKGFEAGKTQAIVTFMNGDTILGYSDGYHAAISQFGPADSNTTLTPFNSGFLIMYQEALAAKNENDADFYLSMFVAQLDDDYDRAFPASGSVSGLGEIMDTLETDYTPIQGLSAEENELLQALEQDLEKTSSSFEEAFPKLNKQP